MDNAVKYIISNEYQKQQENSPLRDVVYCIDKNFLLGAGVSATSILINSKEKYNFHFFTDYIDNHTLEKFNLLAKNFETNVYIYFIDSAAFAKFPVRAKWSVATYYRFIAFHYLSDKTHALYLDADVICKSCPDELFQLDLTGKFAAIIPDLDIVQEKCEARLGVTGLAGKYFNAGVIYINLSEWQKQHFSEKAISMLSDKSKEFSFLDQDVLNILFQGNCVILDNKYNQIYDAAYHFGLKSLSNYKETITDETIFIHYASGSKPWLQWMRYPSSTYFDIAWKQSPWSNEPLLDAHNANLLKSRSKHEFSQKNYLRGIWTQVRYITKKLSDKLS
jgi:lipopolysaccharide biosynthesis glycosyltransferase